MTDTEESEIERIREQKKKELREKRGEKGSAQHGSGAGAGAGAGAAKSRDKTPGSPVEVRGSEHLKEILEENRVVLVDCYADWCGPCAMMEPAVEAFAEGSEAAVAKVDVDANQRLAQELGAQSIPTLVLYVDGEPVERLVGAQDRATLESLVEQAA